LARYGADLAKGFGLTWMGSGEAIGSIYLIGSVIDNILYGDTTSITTVSDLPNNIPLQFELYANYPNPFNPATNIKFALPYEASINIKIYNTLGKEIKELLNEARLSGEYEINWDGTDNFGNKVSSGVYFITMDANSFSKNYMPFRKTIKSILLK
jgi:hypothetical protein